MIFCCLLLEQGEKKSEIKHKSPSRMSVLKCQLTTYIFISHLGINRDLGNMKNEGNQEGQLSVNGVL